MLAPWREASEMNMQRQVNKANQRAQDARRAGDHDRADYVEHLRDLMVQKHSEGHQRGWSDYEPMVHEEFGDRHAAAPDGRHPDLHHSLATHGSVHTTGGRVLPIRVAASANFHDPAGWKFHTAFQPSQHALQGARAYNNLVGLPDPHSGAVDYHGTMRDQKSVADVAKAYDGLPNIDQSHLRHFTAMRDEVNKQHDFMTKKLGIKTQSVDHDPYSDVHEMLADVNNNKTLKVMGTNVTGGHPFFSDEENDKFRAVHDFFGHAATGRSFDRHGEQAAYLAHSQMFSPHALPALASETKGQNSSLIYNGQFGPQKLAVMSPEHYADGAAFHRTAAAVDDEWQRSVMKDVDETGGFTRRGPSGAPPTGFMVSIPGAEKTQPLTEVSGPSIAEYGQEHAHQMDEDPDLYQGGWADDPHFFHDLSRHHTDMWDAVDEARAGDQDAFYHLDSGVAPYTHELTGPGGEHGFWMARTQR